MKNTLLRIIASAIVTSTTQAALVVYNMDTGGTLSSPASSVSANLAASDFTSPGYSMSYITGVSGNAVNEFGWEQADQPNGQYFTFTIQPDSGYRMDISGFSFAERAPGPASMAWALRSSIDSFASDIASGNLPSNLPVFFTYSVPLSYANLNAPVEFRLYAYYLAPFGSNWSVDNVSIDGTVSAVPEPATVQLGLALCGLAILRRRRSA